MVERNIWLFRAYGEGQTRERFCFDRDDIASAYSEFVIGGVTGDPIIDEQQQIEINDFMIRCNDLDEWADGHFGHQIGEICSIHIYRIDPRSIREMINKVMEYGLFI